LGAPIPRLKQDGTLARLKRPHHGPLQTRPNKMYSFFLLFCFFMFKLKNGSFENVQTQEILKFEKTVHIFKKFKVEKC
jgi:hypothetical protein